MALLVFCDDSHYLGSVVACHFLLFKGKTLEKHFKRDASNTSRNVEPMSPSHFLCPFWKPPKSSFPQKYYIRHLGALVFFNPRRFQIASKTSLRFFVDLGYTPSVVVVEVWSIMKPFCIEFLRCWTYTTHTTHHTPHIAQHTHHTPHNTHHTTHLPNTPHSIGGSREALTILSSSHGVIFISNPIVTAHRYFK